jgi:hypothetical protein
LPVELKAVEPDVGGPATLAHEVVILPEEIDDGAIGLYRDELLTLKKELVAQGVDADFLHDASHRSWLGLKGEVAVSIVIGLATSGAVAAVQAWLTRRFGKQRVRIKVVRAWRKETSESRLEWYEAEGSGEEIAAAMEAIRDDPGPGRPV